MSSLIKNSHSDEIPSPTSTSGYSFIH